MNIVELRYMIYKNLIGEVYGTHLISPSPGKPLQIGVLVRDSRGETRTFTISVTED